MKLIIATLLVCTGVVRAELTDDQDRAMTSMQTYCSACHAIEPLRFVVSTYNEANWDYIHANGPSPTETWAQAITRLLDWPTEDPKQLKDPPPPNSRWMPVGQKRYAMTQEMIDHRNARQYLRDVVRNSLE